MNSDQKITNLNNDRKIENNKKESNFSFQFDENYQKNFPFGIHSQNYNFIDARIICDKNNIMKVEGLQVKNKKVIADFIETDHIGDIILLQDKKSGEYVINLFSIKAEY